RRLQLAQHQRRRSGSALEEAALRGEGALHAHGAKGATLVPAPPHAPAGSSSAAAGAVSVPSSAADAADAPAAASAHTVRAWLWESFTATVTPEGEIEVACGGGDDTEEEEEEEAAAAGAAGAAGTASAGGAAAASPRSRVTYELVGCVSHIDPDPTTASLAPEGHLVLHARVPHTLLPGQHGAGEDELSADWLLFNDARVARASVEEVLDFSHAWRTPALLLFRQLAPEGDE
ncbi:MAG: hypothetical protein ACK4GD_12925, partial [Sphingomonadaceae bacterium]